MTFPALIKVETVLDSGEPGSPSVNLLKGPICFNATEKAREFLLANIAVSDDCSKVVRLEVEYLDESSDSGLASFLATATDERCKGGQGNHVHSEIFQIEIFNGYDTQGLLADNTVVRGMGCDGRDQNCNGIIDDCE